MKKTPHIIWVCPKNDLFFRSKGEVKSRPHTVLPKLSEQKLDLDILIPYDATLLPKTKLSTQRTSKHSVKLSQNYPIELIKLSKGAQRPGIYMVKTPLVEPPVFGALLSRAALLLAKQINRTVDVFHLFGWNAALLPLYLEMDDRPAVVKEARTFFTIDSVNGEGNFAPGTIDFLGLPNNLFHPEALEFYGQVSFLKTGILFSDGVGVVDGRNVSVNGKNMERQRFQGIFDSQVHKLRRWASARSLRAYLDAYYELLRAPKAAPLLPRLLKRLHTTPEQVQEFIDSWGPAPENHYGIDRLSFLVQSPKKAYALWEWTHPEHRELGVILETGAGRHLLSRGLGHLGDYWFDVEPDQEYLVELVGWTASGKMETLMRSRKIRTPRDSFSPNTQATFVDVKTKRKFMRDGDRRAWGRWVRAGASEMRWLGDIGDSGSLSFHSSASVQKEAKR